MPKKNSLWDHTHDQHFLLQRFVFVYRALFILTELEEKKKKKKNLQKIIDWTRTIGAEAQVPKRLQNVIHM